ncbi:molybdate ABC transporter substrate-binding protein [Sinomonas flava]|uniref:Molybdate ABC transporter substrate-binding protein n=1 Tax=Sinomonas flava TaxID=496857 RepID=A0ABN3BJ69_9MICC
MRRLIAAAAAAVGLVALTACGGMTGGSGASSSSVKGSVTVFAAASLKQSFTDIGKKFETANPGVEVTFNFAGSSDLAAQISQGAKADVFASADTRTMDKITGGGLADGDPRAFATNTLVIAVRPGNPAGITGLADLAKPGVKLVACAPQVPCGSAARTAEAAADNGAGITLRPVSEESNVTDVLGKVIAGEADAGLVYITDVRGSGGKAEAVTFPEAASAVNTYPIVPLAESKNVEAARAFTAYVLGPDGRKALADAGFGAP